MVDPVKTDSIEIAAAELLKGNLVAIPTETVYGLAADATRPEAVARVFNLKGRPADHPLIVHCASKELAFSCCSQISESARLLAEAFWPGPMTLVLPRSEKIDLQITGGQDSVAVRVPAHPLTLKLLQEVDRPIVAPSANRFGKVSPTSADHVADEFSGEHLTILDGGQCEVGIESTIVDCRDDQNVRVLRPGKITEQAIKNCIGNQASSNSGLDNPIRVSGNLPSHYAPTAKVILIEHGQTQQWLRDLGQKIECTFLITTDPQPDQIREAIDWNQIPPCQEDYARNLYSLLREADRKQFPQVAFELPEAAGIGVAIRDRLGRASNG